MPTQPRCLELSTKHKDKDIKMSPNTLPFAIESGLANSTNKKYFHGWKTWPN